HKRIKTRENFKPFLWVSDPFHLSRIVNFQVENFNVDGLQLRTSLCNNLKGARDLCRGPDLMKKQCVVDSTQLQNRCLLRPRIFHLPAAYPRIDLALLIQTDPQRFWITGRLSSVYHR